ncbi:MAG TPA: DUF899 family protein [Alphaproteobacteria bacterium]|nr:DUF899 family protein [Alphaproteobacteria bacterium]
MNYKDSMAKVGRYREEIAEIRKKMRDAQSAIEPEVTKNYRLAAADGPVSLSDLFGRQDTLIVIHNMGAGCRFCTLWADGFNGVYDHLQSRAAFVVASPDAPDQQRKFAVSRGWRFPMVSYQGSSFGEDMGYRTDDGARPGVSVFKRDGDKIVRVSDTSFGPGDDFCSVWHIFDLIPEGAAGWQPKYHYDSENRGPSKHA